MNRKSKMPWFFIPLGYALMVSAFLWWLILKVLL